MAYTKSYHAVACNHYLQKINFIIKYFVLDPFKMFKVFENIKKKSFTKN